MHRYKLTRYYLLNKFDFCFGCLNIYTYTRTHTYSLLSMAYYVLIKSVAYILLIANLRVVNTKIDISELQRKRK